MRRDLQTQLNGYTRDPLEHIRLYEAGNIYDAQRWPMLLRSATLLRHSAPLIGSPRAS